MDTEDSKMNVDTPGDEVQAKTNIEVPEPRSEDTITTKAELLDRKYGQEIDIVDGERPAKRVRTDDAATETPGGPQPRQKGVAQIKAEYLLDSPRSQGSNAIDDDAAEAGGKADARDRPKREKQRGQNKARDFGISQDEKGLCSSRATYPEFSPAACSFGEKCRFEHDLRKYLKEWKRSDLDTFNSKCPVFAAKGWCSSGWKCRFVGSHSTQQTTEDGREELILLREKDQDNVAADDEDGVAVVNVASQETRTKLMKKKFETRKTDQYLEWMNSDPGKKDLLDDDDVEDERQENRAMYKEPPFLPSEKRKIYFGPETPILAPLTTQGNQPFRRLCVNLGAQLTYSEMAMSMPLIQGQRSEWALMKAHDVETQSPRFDSQGPVVQGYDNAKDFRFGAQIASNKPWVAMRTAETLAKVCSHLRVIDLNCGCPIDLVCRPGAGSSLLDNPSKLEKMIRGMNAVSDSIPITAKIRMGTRDAKPTATKLVNRLVYGTEESQASGDPPSGVATITLHGRSKQQRYTRSADWEYIASCAALINRHRETGDSLSDTIREPDPRTQPPSSDKNKSVYFLGNGDVYSHTAYLSHLTDARVDGVMLGRGALIKPWLFEEISTGQYLDKSSRERLDYIEQFCRFGLEAWGSDERGVGTTRRFLLEWMNFAHRYVPLGILERLPPSLQERAPAWRGRDELEGLLGSEDYRDWIKISEMFLGPAHKDFRFVPKHKSNSYEIEAEG